MSIEAAYKSVEDLVLATDIDLDEKIKQLKTIEQEKYKPLVREFVYKKTIPELKSLSHVLEDLAYLSTNLGDMSGNLQHYTDAATFYQSAITTINEKLNPDLNDPEYVDKITQIYTVLDTISHKIMYSSSIITDGTAALQNTLAESAENKKILSDLRESVAVKISVVEDRRVQSTKTEDVAAKAEYQEQYVNSARRLFEEITDSMKGFLAKLYHDAELEIGEPPCKYTVIGLGSMALKQITPYSDLEFAILTENEDYKSSDWPTIRDYFKNLSHLVNFKMINLGETIIPTSRYGVDMSHLVHRAVNFDLGGKTPLGRIEHDKTYDLVQTVEKMLWYVRNEEEKASHIDKNLPYILEKVVHVYGDDTLLKSYQDGVTEFLHGSTTKTITHINAAGDIVTKEVVLSNYQDRVLKRLKDGVTEIDYGKPIPLELPQKGYLEQFVPLAAGEGKLFDVKEEIYRLPDRLLYSLGQYYGIDENSVWDVVDALQTRGIITEDASTHLKYAATFATTLRLKTYLHNKSQTENMSLFAEDVTKQAEAVFHLSADDLSESGGLFQYFYTSLELHKKLEQFCDERVCFNSKITREFFQNDAFYKSDMANKGFVYYRLVQYAKARENLEDALESIENQRDLPRKLLINNLLADIYVHFGEIDQAITLLKCCLKIYDRLEVITKAKLPVELYASLQHDLGCANTTKGNYDEAIAWHEKSLNMWRSTYRSESDKNIDANHPDENIASVWNSLGSTYRSRGDRDEALRCHKKSLEIIEIVHKKVADHTDVAASQNNLGNTCFVLGLFDEAIERHEKALEMLQRIYRYEPHLEVAASLDNLGRDYCFKKDYDKAIEYHKQSLEMQRFIYQKDLHPSTASYLRQLGDTYLMKGEYDEAIKKITEAFEIEEEIYGDQFYPNRYAALSNLGTAHLANRNYDEAIRCFTELVEMNKERNSEEFPANAAFLLLLGRAYDAKGDLSQALKHFASALKVLTNFGLDRLEDGEKMILGRVREQFVEFAKNHWFPLDMVFMKVMLWGADFADYKKHLDEIDLLKARCATLAEIMVSSRLALTLLPEDDVIIERQIYSMLADLIGDSTSSNSLELWIAAASGSVDKIVRLLDTEVGIEINIVILNITPLICGVMAGNIDVVKALIDKGANVNIPENSLGTTPLYISLGLYDDQPVNMDVVRLLLERNADVKIAANDGDTPMHMAHYKGNIEAIKLLLSYHADLNAQNHIGKTPLRCLLEQQDIPLETKQAIISEFSRQYDRAIQDILLSDVVSHVDDQVITKDTSVEHTGDQPPYSDPDHV